MCGICGIVTDGNRATREKVDAMLRHMRHRGPDAAGAWHGQGVSLGNCRLAIVGLGTSGNQPICNEKQTLWITFNGMIYNYQDLRKDLVRLGHHFMSTTDTEVIVHLYEEYGKDCLLHLRGMFAFAIWDTEKRELFLARDRLGIKPLYYTTATHSFGFASEVKALLEAELAPRTLDARGVVGFFSLGSVPQPSTLIQGISALLPGHYLELKDGTIRVQEYWRPSFLPKAHPSPEEARALTRDNLEEAVRTHLVSEVPLGVFLSGGVDSSVMVAMMRKYATGLVKTFNITFPETAFSEAPFAKMVAARFETEHHEETITCEQLKGELAHIITAMDQPTIDGVNTYFVSRVTRESGIVVALSGLGGDELFGGYQTFRDVPMLYRGLTPLRLTPAGVRNLLYRIASSRDSGVLRQKFASVLDSGVSLEEIYAAHRACFVDGALSGLIRPEFWDSLDSGFILDYARDMRPADGGVDFGDRISFLEMSIYMSNQLLRDADAMSMAHSLEVRVPFLDHVFVDLVSHLPCKLRGDGKAPKALLIDAVRDLLPREVVERKKQGFTFPIDPWLRQGLRPVVSEALSPENVRKTGVLQPAAVDSLWKRFLQRENAVEWSRVWMPFVFQLWCAEVLGD